MRLNRFCSTAVAILLLAGAGCSGDKEGNTREPKGRTLDYTGEVAFLSSSGDTLVTLQVAVADDQQERSEGLMDVNRLPSDKGMLFKFEQQEPLSFWMANTPLSLDIIFVNQTGKIVRIHQNTQPFTEENFRSGEPAMYAVETNAGFCLTHDIQEGMRVVF